MAFNKQVVTSKTPTEEQRFTWKIANFSHIRCSKKALELQHFRFEMGSSIGLSTKWKCYLECRQNLDEDGDWIGVYVTREKGLFEKSCKDLHLRMSLKIGNAEKNFFEDRSKKLHDIGEEKSVGFPKVIARNNRRVPLDADGNLCLNLKLNLFNLAPNSTTPDAALSLSNLETQFGARFQKNLTRTLSKLLDNPEQLATDQMKVVLISSDWEKFSVNREILAARSPVFLAMFQTDMVESNKGVVQIDDVSGKALKILLKYMYTGVLSKDWKEPEVIEEVTYAANKYLLKDLLEFLDQALGLACTPENCGNLLRLAKQSGMKKGEKDLKQVFKQQLKQGSLEDVMQCLFKE